MPILQDSIDLSAISIASPCTVSWDSMKGDAKKRYCGQCRLHVHNFSEMTGDEIRDLVGSSNGRVCGRIWRRVDGTMVTADCIKTRRERARRAAARGLAFAGTLFASAAMGMGLTKAGGPEELLTAVKNSGPVQTLLGIFGFSRNTPPPIIAGGIAPMGVVAMGDVMVPPPVANNGQTSSQNNSTTKTEQCEPTMGAIEVEQ